MAHNIFTFLHHINYFYILDDGIRENAACTQKGCLSPDELKNPQKRDITDQTDMEDTHVINNQVCTPNEVKMEVSLINI